MNVMVDPAVIAAVMALCCIVVSESMGRGVASMVVRLFGVVVLLVAGMRVLVGVFS